jgi:hypothetical protein
MINTSTLDGIIMPYHSYDKKKYLEGGKMTVESNNSNTDVEKYNLILDEINVVKKQNK